MQNLDSLYLMKDYQLPLQNPIIDQVMSSLDDSKYGKINQREFKKALQETLEDNGL